MAPEGRKKAIGSPRGHKVNEHTLIEAIAEELGAVVATLLGGSPTVNPNSAQTDSAAWMVKYTVRGPLEGTASLFVPVDDAARLTSTVLGFDDAPPDDAVIDNLQEIAKQIAGSLNNQPDLDGITLSADDPAVRQNAVPESAVWVKITVGELVLLAAASSSTVARAAEAAKPAAKSAHAPLASSPVTADGPPPTPVPHNLDLILDMDLPLWVRFGFTNMTLQALSKLAPGTTVDLERAPEDPVEVLVNNIVVARGEVVVVSGNYGVRVTEVVSTQARIRSMGPAR